ncbi:amino acid adenylation domain-containing protein, partial [Paucibacter sp. APW11]
MDLHAVSPSWFPLSEAQRSRWFLYQFDSEGRGAHNNAFAVRVRGGLEASTLQRALEQLTVRHPMLGARLRQSGGRAEQSTDAGAPLKVELRGGLDAAALLQAVRADSVRVFDLEQEPPFRAVLYPEASGDTVLLLVFDHLFCDGWSFWLVLEELGQALQGDLPAPQLTAPAYRDYVESERAWLAGTEAQRAWKHWLAALGGDLPLLRLPCDHVRGPGVGSELGQISIELPAALLEGLRGLARRHAGTLYTTLLAAYMMLLHRLSGQNDIIVGTPMPGRVDPRWNPVVGDFVNAIAIRHGFAEDEAVADTLRAVRGAAMQGLRHQELPFGLLVERLNPPREPGVHPVFQTLFNFQKARAATALLALWREGSAQRPGGQLASWAGHELQAYPVYQSGGTALDLSLEVIELDAGLRCDFRFDVSLFEQSTVERIGGHYVNLLEAMVAEVERTVARLPLIDAQQRLELTLGAKSNSMPGTALAAETPDTLVHEPFERVVRRAPLATALRDAGVSLSYGELDAASNRLAAWLRTAGVVADERVAICARRGLAQLTAVLAVLKAGGAYVPLDPQYPVDRLSHVLHDCAARLVLVDAAGEQALGGGGRAEALSIRAVHLEHDAHLWAGASETRLARAAGPQHLAYVIYTSGSTGLPKGVAVTHANVANLVAAQSALLRLDEGDRVLQFASFGFDSSVAEIYPALGSGATLVLRPDQLLAPDADFAAFMRAERITVCDLATAFWHQWSHELAAGRCAPNDELRLVAVGGEAAKAHHLRQWLSHPRARLCRWINAYGPTENTVNSTVFELAPGASFDAPEVPIGRPIAGTRAYILDAHLEPVPLGVTGELYLAGAQVARGYLNRADLSAERFLRDPFVGDADARMYRTGDLGRRLADGTIEYLGRNDFQVKIRGFRIELGEIEAKLAACEGVREAVVLALPDPRGEPRLVAYLIATGIDVLALRARLARELPEYMLPSAFVRLEAWPLNASGKVDRKALPKPAGDALPSRAYEQPQGELETVLAAAWCALLGLERVGRLDHFFELGGHSLLATQLAARVRDQLGVELPLRLLFAAPVLRDLAAQLEGMERQRSAGQAHLATPMLRADRSQPLPLAWSQQRLWFLDHLDAAAGAAYRMPAALRLRGQLNRAALKATLDRLVARHEILRTRFVAVQGQPSQVVDSAAGGFALEELDARGDTLAALQREFFEARFDLAAGPLIRGRLLKLSDDHHLLLIDQHHIVSDGWSIAILVREVATLYAAFCADRADPLPPLSLQFADYAAWQRSAIASASFERQLDYWRERLAGAPELLALPTDRPRPAQQSYAGAALAFEFDA